MAKTQAISSTSSSILYPFFLRTIRASPVPVIKKLPQAALDQKRRKGTSHKSKRRFVVYFISQCRSILVRLNQVTMTPAAKGPLDLNVFEHVRRIIYGMFGNPLNCYRPKNSRLDYRSRANF